MNTQTIINSRDRSSTTPHEPTCGLPRSPEQSREEETKNENGKYEQSC